MRADPSERVRRNNRHIRTLIQAYNFYEMTLTLDDESLQGLFLPGTVDDLFFDSSTSVPHNAPHDHGNGQELESLDSTLSSFFTNNDNYQGM